MNRNKEIMLLSIIITAFFAISWFIFYNQSISDGIGKYPSDLPLHIKYAKQFYEGKLSVPHPGLYVLSIMASFIFFTSINNGFVITLSLGMTAIFFIYYHFFKKSLSQENESSHAFLTVCLLLISAIYIPAFNPNQLLGQALSNVWHNPTLIVIKPFAFIALWISASVLSGNATKKQKIILSIVLLIGLFMKPNFMIAFIPSVAIFLAIKRSMNKFIEWFFILLPSFAGLLVQFLITYGDKSGSKVIFTAAEVWKRYSPNPLISSLLSIAFPLAIILFRYRHVIKNNRFILAALTLGIAYLQNAFLAEQGERFYDFNFGWGAQIVIPMVFLFSIIEYVKWYRENELSLKWGFIVSSVLLTLHMVSGMYYFIKIILGYHYA